MPEAFTAQQQDTRTFGDMLARLIDDLNRPDLQQQAQQYIQDAIRFHSRMAFAFNEIDNTAVPAYANSTIYPQGSCIQVPNVGGNTCVFCALNQGTSASSGTPAWPTIPFTVPPTAFPPPPPGSAGTVQDNTVLWANIGFYSPQIHTQLSTIYNINQYVPPLDYAIPRVIEVTWSNNIRFQLEKVSYFVLRGFDVIRPTPPSTYPTMWAWFQQQIYLWPYPVGFYPITLSYITAPPVPKAPNESSFWTTTAERLIRKFTQATMERELLHDDDAAVLSMSAYTEEKRTLRSIQIQQDRGSSNSGIPPSAW